MNIQKFHKGDEIGRALHDFFRDGRFSTVSLNKSTKVFPQSTGIAPPYIDSTSCYMCTCSSRPPKKRVLNEVVKNVQKQLGLLTINISDILFCFWFIQIKIIERIFVHFLLREGNSFIDHSNCLHL